MDAYQKAYRKRVEILRNSKEYGNIAAGVVGIIEAIFEVAAEQGYSNEFIVEEVKEKIRAYKEAVEE